MMTYCFVKVKDLLGYSQNIYTKVYMAKSSITSDLVIRVLYNLLQGHILAFIHVPLQLRQLFES